MLQHTGCRFKGCRDIDVAREIGFGLRPDRTGRSHLMAAVNPSTLKQKGNL